MLNLETILHDHAAAVDALELFLTEYTARTIDFRNNHLHSVSEKNLRGLGIRVIHNGRIGFNGSTDLRNIAALINRAKESALFGQHASFEFTASKTLPSVELYDAAVSDYSHEDAIALGEQVIADITREHPVMVNGSITLTTGTACLANSAGALHKQSSSRSSLFFSAVVTEDDGGFQEIYDAASSRRLNLDTAPLKNNILRQLEWSKNLYPFKTSSLPVVFVPEIMGDLLTALELGCNGNNVLKKVSPLIGRENELLLDPRISITDDPLIPFGVGSFGIDDEGTPAVKTPLITDGKLTGFIWDNQTAGLMHTRSTGNGQRGYSSPPSPAYSNLVIAEGNTSLNEILAGLDNCVLITHVIGGGQSNLIAGDFSLNIGLGFYMEKGIVKGRIKNAMLAGNVYHEFKNNLLALSQERRIHGGIITPAFIFKKMNIIAG